MRLGARLELGDEQRQVVLPVRLPGPERIGQTQTTGAEDENLGDGDEFAYTTSAFSIDRLIGQLVHGASLGGDE